MKHEWRDGVLMLGEGLKSIFDKPLWWHEKNLLETASGYGDRLTTRYSVVTDDGVMRRVYCTCFSNVGTHWVNVKGKRQVVDFWQDDVAPWVDKKAS